MTEPDIDVIKRCVSLHKEKTELKGRLATVEAQLKVLEPQALEWMTQHGVPQIRQGGVTAHIRREVWASLAEGVELDFLRHALQASGIDPDDVIKAKANSQTLSSIVREFEHRGERLPAVLADALKVSEVFKLGYRKADSDDRTSVSPTT